MPFARPAPEPSSSERKRDLLGARSYLRVLDDLRRAATGTDRCRRIHAGCCPSPRSIPEPVRMVTWPTEMSTRRARRPLQTHCRTTADLRIRGRCSGCQNSHSRAEKDLLHHALSLFNGARGRGFQDFLRAVVHFCHRSPRSSPSVILASLGLTALIRTSGLG